MELTIPHFKPLTNQQRFILNRTLLNHCFGPFNVCQIYLAIRLHKTIDEALFSFMDGTPVSRNFFTEHLQRSFSSCGLDIQKYHSHSFRIGAVTTAASTGLSEIQIQNMVRWKSSSYKKYIRIPSLQL